jgi:hypothetical protein
MKLIRVTTTDENGRFDGILNADISINPQSKIAMQQLALEIDVAEIQLDGNTNQITFNQGDEAYVGEVQQGVYSTNEGDELLRQVENAMNETCLFRPDGVGNPNIQGAEYRASVNNSGKVQFEFRKGTMGEFSISEWETSTDITVTQPDPPAQIFWGVDALLQDDDPRPMSASSGRIPNGNAYMECTIYDAAENAANPKTDPTRSGVWLCYTDIDIRNIDINDIQQELETQAGRAKYCQYGVGANVQSVDGSVRYIRIIDGEAQTMVGADSPPLAGTPDARKPRIRLQRSSGGDIFAKYWDTATEGIEKLSPNLRKDVGKEFFQLIIFWDSQNFIEISQVQGCLSAFANDAISVNYKEADYATTSEWGLGAKIKTDYTAPQGLSALGNLYQPNATATNNSIAFGATSLANFLGFTRLRIPESGSRSGVNFLALARLRYAPRITSDTIIVLSESIPLSSYDSTIVAQAGQGQRRSILAVVPTNDADGRVAYSPTSTFLDVNLATPLSLRNLRFRLVNSDYTPFRLFGKASMVVLIEG